VAATFLPLYGPLPPETDFVRRGKVLEPPASGATVHARIDDRTTVQLATLQVKVWLRAAQMADPEMTSALQLFRRAANVLARLEDLVVFRGLIVDPNSPDPDSPELVPGGGTLPPKVYDILCEEPSDGLWSVAGTVSRQPVPTTKGVPDGHRLVDSVAASILKLEESGHFGPFSVVLGHGLFHAAVTPAVSLVLPQDRIIPFLGGGSLLRSSALDPKKGVVVALGGAPVELVVATDMSLGFLQVTTDPMFVFRVFEKIVLRIKQPEAIGKLTT
jgi:uncharacterized linocin/CFP29 family protein